MKTSRLAVAAIASLLMAVAFGANREASPEELAVVRETVAAVLRIPLKDVVDSATLAKQVKRADSLHFVEIVTALEKRTGREITDAAMKGVVGSFSMRDVAERVTVKQLADVLANSPKR